MNTRLLGIFLIFSLAVCTNLSVNAYNSYYNRPSSSSQTQNIFSDYMNNVRATIQNNWNPPDFLESGHIRVVFKLNRKGKIISYDIIESSGNPIYDDSAIYTLKKIKSFGEFPEESTRETLTINYLFETSILNIGMTSFYYDKAQKLERTEPQKALEYINLAIKENGENDNCIFLYKKRAEIKSTLNDSFGAKEDLNKYKILKSRSDIKRAHALKHLAETENSSYNYFYLAYAYEQINDIPNAITAIDKAIALDSSNYNYKRFKEKLLTKH